MVEVAKPPPGAEKPAVRQPDKKPRSTKEAAIVGLLKAREKGNPDKALAALAAEGEVASSNKALKVDVGQSGREQVALLRDETLVGKDKYGESLVNKHQKGQNTPLEHETAQAIAYADLQGKIDAGVVNPVVMGTEICLKLEVKPDLENVPESYDGIMTQVSQELKVFRESGALSEAELATITSEMAEFTTLYGEAYGTEDVKKAYEVVRDNARKLTYQHVVDKQVFSGSDHGLRHIVNGNIRFGKQMIDSLRANGVNVSKKDELMLHQVMIDHDLGYTTGAAQAPKGFDASKDHPLVSAKYIEDNKEYYLDKFGEDGYKVIFDSVLNHSYPRLEYQSDATDGIHSGLVRGITSTVDSLGVTVETKTPEFFWNGDAMKTLLKIRLAQETMGGKVPEELMGKYRQELLVLASQEKNADRRTGYENAVTNFFNEVTAENTLGHYTGIVKNVTVEEVPEDGHTAEPGHEAHGHGGHEDHEGEDKRFRVVVEMTPTEVYALLGNMFGDKLATGSFAKAMKDLGLDTGKLAAHARSLRAGKRGGMPAEALNVVSDQARVVVGANFAEDLPQEQREGMLDSARIQEISGVFQEVEMLSARTEINELLEGIQDGNGRLDMIQFKFISGISEKTTAAEVTELSELVLNLSDTSLTGEKDAKGNDLTVSETAKTRLKGYLTAKEKAFLGV